MDIMVKYNAVMTLLTGVSLLALGWLGLQLKRPLKVVAEGWGLMFMGLGFLVGILGLLMSLTWPLIAVPHLSMLFGNIPMILGVFLLLAGIFMYWRWNSKVANLKSDDEARKYLQQVLKPFCALFFAVGLGLLAFTFAVYNYKIFGTPPPVEPVKGWLTEHWGSWLELNFVGVLIFGLGTLGTLLAPLGLRNLNGKLFRFICVALAVAGIAAILYGALHFYTHVGLGEAFS